MFGVPGGMELSRHPLVTHTPAVAPEVRGPVKPLAVSSSILLFLTTCFGQFGPFPTVQKLYNFCQSSGLPRNSIFCGRRTWSTQHASIAPSTKSKKSHRPFCKLHRGSTQIGKHVQHTQTHKIASRWKAEIPTGSRPF